MQKIFMIAVTSAFLLSTFAATEAVADIMIKCKACHSFSKNHKAGPSLAGIIGAKAGNTSFEKYSEALKTGAWTWDEEHLRAWICDSQKAVKEFTYDEEAKTKMPALGICGTAEQAAVIKALRSL